jgi:chromosome partitioning protein
MMLTQTGKEFRLKEALAPIQENYDYIIIDTPPALGILTINALTACTGIIVPAQADIYSLQGIGQLYGTIKPVRQYCNPELRILGILLTRYNQRSIISRDIAEMMAQTAAQLETIVYKATIREAVAVKEAQARQRDIYSYAPKGRVTADYASFVEEVLAQ